MEDQSDIIMQASIKMVLLFYYFPEFIQERRKVPQWRNINTGIRIQMNNCVIELTYT